MPDEEHAGAARLIEQALRLNARYLDEVVLGWRLCPWAERALREGQVRRQVLLGAPPPAAELLRVVDALAADPQAAIGLLIFPQAALDAPAFDRLAEGLRRADRARRAPGAPSDFLIAAFHPFPVGQGDPAGPPQLVPLLRRTPDPTLQLVRAQLLAPLGEEVSADVARQNFAHVARRGVVALRAALDDIRADRDRSYRAQ